MTTTMMTMMTSRCQVVGAGRGDVSRWGFCSRADHWQSRRPSRPGVLDLSPPVASSSASRGRSGHHDNLASGAYRKYTTTAGGSQQRSPPSAGLDIETAVESLRYWNDLINKIDRPTARMMLSKIDRENLTGVDTTLKGVSTSKNSLYQFLLDVKVEHPTKVVLIRVGEFYETWGFDAVLLVEHCGLNPMGYRLPRAGCPRMNIQRTLDDLTAKGLRCVVCEEAPMPYSYGARSKRKTRFVAQVVTPHSPIYVYNLSSNHGLSPDFNFQAPPVVGIEQRKQDAFTVMLMDVDLRQFTTYHDVNEEIAAHIISSNGFSPPVYCHESYLGSPDSGPHGQKIHSIIQDSLKVRVRGGPFKHKFVESVKQDLGLGQDSEFMESSSSTESKRPFPLYNMTAKSIGLATEASNSNIPSLVSAVLPKDAPAASKHFLARYLMHPPPPSVAESVQKSLQRISQVTRALPLLPILPAHKIAKMIHSKEANHSVYVDLLAMLKGIQDIFESSELEEALFPLTAVAAMSTGKKFKTSEIRDVCDEVIEEIEKVVNTAEYQELMSSVLDTVADGEEEGDGGDDAAGEELPLAGSSRSGDQAAESLVYANEKSVRIILASCIEKELKLLEEARSRVKDAIQGDLEPALEALLNESRVTVAQSRAVPRISFDAVNNSVSIRGAGSQRTQWAKEFGLTHPKDRNGSRLADRFSTERVEEALDEYRFLCHELDLAVKQALKDLAGRISPFVTQVVYLSHLALVSKSFWLHATEAARKGWALPTLVQGGDEGERTLRLDNFWPFWMDSSGDETVKNSILMDKLTLLTGPNMAGKSTIIRSVCSTSLLGNCGLYAPCDSSSRVPHFDAYILRSAESADSPAEGLSTFAVEMSDARAIVRDATDRSLVFVDELCKGTEARAGACIAAATVEHLSSQTRCLGLFATHLHDMLKLPLDSSNLDFMKMETKVQEGEQTWKRETTWKVVEGVCTESLAYQVAEKYGVPKGIVERAWELQALGEEVEEVGDKEDKEDEERKGRGKWEGGARDFATGVEILKTITNEALGLERDAIVLGRGQAPPPMAMGSSCVYFYRLANDVFYVGETDDIMQRFTTWESKHNSNGNGNLMTDFAFVVLPRGAGGKSTARELETKTIRTLANAGYNLMNEVY